MGGRITEIPHIIGKGAENKTMLLCHSVTACCTLISNAHIQFWSPHLKEYILESQKVQPTSPKIIKATEQMEPKSNG